MANPKPKNAYPIQTNPETNAMLQATSDGKTGRHWQTITGADARVHQVPGASHRVYLTLTDGERELGIAVDSLAGITAKCDADDDFIFLYISRLLTPAQPVPAGLTPIATVDLDAVIKAVGWYPQNTNQRVEMRRRVWQFIKFVSRARVIGERSYKRRDKMTGEKIETYLDSPPWMLGTQERPLEREQTTQISLFADDEPPLTVEIAVTPEWARVALSPQMAQFLPLGEVLGAIPGSRPSGAWARVVGLALANFWRRNPREAMSGKLKPTRRELLERYTPSTGAVADVLSSDKPGRAIDYWAGALQILIENEFLANEGEAALSVEEMRADFPRFEWAELWLDGTTDLRPGPALSAAVEERAEALPAKKKKRRKR